MLSPYDLVNVSAVQEALTAENAEYVS